ncbi:MAG TPA: TonB-dependent receptor [Acidisarcina sp.]
MRLKSFLGAGLLAGSLLALVPASLGQAVYGSIVGTVTDPSGAIVPNATVTVTDEAKGTTTTFKSNDGGEFTADHLIPDSYDVKVESPGFKTFEVNGILVSADTSRRLEAGLQPGGADQTVTVTADSVPQLKTDRADVSTVFGAKEIQDLPIGDRNFTNLQLLLPGAQQLGWSHAASENPQGSKQIQVDGQAFGGVAFELDGTDNQDPILGIIVINPNIDSLAESKITTQNFDAEFGKAVSSVVTAQTKSGSNSFHGSIFDYRQSAANLAREPFSQPKTVTDPTTGLVVGNPIPAGLKNQFGGSLGGPIIKDRLFFFSDYQGVRQKVGTSNVQTVPTPFLISTCLGTTVGASGIPGCDFSEYVQATASLPPASQIIIYQPNGTAYPGNVIPTAQLSPQALALFKLLQPYQPNVSDGSIKMANGQSLDKNYAGSGTGGFNSNQWDVRSDYQLTERIHTFGRFSRFTDTLTGKTLFGAAGGAGFGLGQYGGNSSGANDSLALGTDIAINPSLVTDVRLGYYRYNIKNQKYDAGVNFASQLGIPNENTTDPITSGAPLFNITEVGAFGGPNNSQGTGPQYGGGLNVTRCNCPLKEKEDQFQLVNNWTKTLGNHAIKFGADLRYARNLRVPSDNDRTGNNNFGTGPTSNGSTGGLGFATFVLGDVTQYNRYVSTSTNAKEFQKRDFVYVQDTWRASPKLTINYGLRYEAYFPEVINSKGQGAVLNLNTGYLQVAGVGEVKSNMNFNKARFPFNPRLGVAYQVNDKTVIRAGYGRSFDIGVFGSLFGHVATQNLPILANQSITATGGPTSFAFNLANGPPTPTPVSVPSDGLLPNPGYAVTSRARPITVRLPTIDAWNLSIQQSITPTVSMTLAYVGNKGTHNLSAGDGNNTNPNEAAIFLPAEFSVTGAPLHFDPSVASNDISGVPLNLVGTGISGISASGGTKNTTYLRRYYGGKLAACSDPAYAAPVGVPSGSCGWTNDIGYYGDDQDTHFNALQATLTKTFTRGLSVNANYAWQRGFDFNSSYSTWDKKVTKGRSDSIREQQIIVYGLYQLPFGHDRQFLNRTGWVNAIVGGIQISPVINYSSGLPFTLSASCPNTPGDAPCYVNGRPDALQTGLHGRAGGSGAEALTFYNAQTLGTQFTVPGLDQIGNSGRNSVFGPHFFNADMALQKDFTLHEKYTAQLRVDAYNAFNHINFGNPGGNVTSSGSIGGEPGGAQPRQLQFSARIQF